MGPTTIKRSTLPAKRKYPNAPRVEAVLPEPGTLKFADLPMEHMKNASHI